MFPALQNLYLTQNHINRISPGAFITLASLQILDLSLNVIEMLPKERLQGLHQLTKLNVSQNNLRDLEEFSQDLALLKSLDLSHNQLNKIDQDTFGYLLSLKELYLTANRLTTIPMDSFKALRKLEVLDIMRNHFETIPLKALKPLETHIKHLRIAGNYHKFSNLNDYVFGGCSWLTSIFVLKKVHHLSRQVLGSGLRNSDSE